MNSIFAISKTYSEIKKKIEAYSQSRVPFILYGNTGSRKKEFISYCFQEMEILFSEMDGSLFYNKDLFLERWNQALENRVVILYSVERFPQEIQGMLNRELMRLKEIKELPWVVTVSEYRLRDMVSKKLFLEDLYYRLGIVSFEIPPLFQRKNEIIPIANSFLEIYKKEFSKPRLKYISDALADFLLKFNYPGDLEQLDNLIKVLVILGKGRTLDIKNIPRTIFKEAKIHSERIIPIIPGVTLQDYEREIIKENLILNNGNRDKTAEILNISVRTLYRKINEYDLKDLVF